jgi:hypothetical protein
VLQRLLAQRDTLVRAITSAAGTQEWEQVMAAFDGLLGALKELEASVERDARREVRSDAHDNS